jgi:hypothetical protein
MTGPLDSFLVIPLIELGMEWIDIPYISGIPVFVRRGVRTIPACNAVRRGFTYYRFIALRRHCSVGFRCVYTSRFLDIQKRFIEKKLQNGEFLHYAWKKATSFCSVCSLCVKTAFNLDPGRITV